MNKKNQYAVVLAVPEIWHGTSYIQVYLEATDEKEAEQLAQEKVEAGEGEFLGFVPEENQVRWQNVEVDKVYPIHFTPGTVVRVSSGDGKTIHPAKIHTIRTGTGYACPICRYLLVDDYRETVGYEVELQDHSRTVVSAEALTAI